MNVTLKMKIQDQEIDLAFNLTMYVTRIYRQQYNRDILKDMAEIYNLVNPSPFAGIDFSDITTEGKTEDEIYSQVIDKALPNYFTQREKEILLDLETTEKACQIAWAFAKNAGETKDYEDWICSFDFVFPVKDVITALYDAWYKSATPIIESKN